MILGDQGGGGWGYQIVNIGAARGPTMPAESQSWNPTLAKKTRKDVAPGSPRVAADVAAGDRSRCRSRDRSIAQNAGRVGMWFRLTEVTSTLRPVPV